MNRHKHFATAASLNLMLCLAVVLFLSPGYSFAQSGKDDFQHYCAACHGLDGKGKGTWNGVEVPDLTVLTRQNGGKFPFEEIHRVVDGRSKARWHQRVRAMPYWGEVYEAEANNPAAKAQVESRIAAIVDYVRTLQVK